MTTSVQQHANFSMLTYKFIHSIAFLKSRKVGTSNFLFKLGNVSLLQYVLVTPIIIRFMTIIIVIRTINKMQKNSDIEQD